MKGDLVGLRSGDSAVEIRREWGKFSPLVYTLTHRSDILLYCCVELWDLKSTVGAADEAQL